jgi:hypothetical protein
MIGPEYGWFAPGALGLLWLVCSFVRAVFFPRRNRRVR